MGCHMWFYIPVAEYNNEKVITEFAITEFNKVFSYSDNYVNSYNKSIETGLTEKEAHLIAMREYYNTIADSSDYGISDNDLLELIDFNFFEEHAHLLNIRKLIESGDYNTIMEFSTLGKYNHDSELKTWQLYIYDPERYDKFMLGIKTFFEMNPNGFMEFC